MKIFKQSWLILLLITFFAFGQRIYQINTNPPSLNWDEVSHGYNAYSILKTGADEWGNKLPLIFRAFGDYKLPLYIYLTTIPIYFFGLTPLAVRLVSVIAGTLAIPAIYLLTNQLFSKDFSSDDSEKGRTLTRSDLIGLLSALLLAISPWHFFISRPALEANLALTLIIFGIWALLKALKTPKFYLLSSVLLGLSLHTYNSARIFVPLILLSFLVIYFKKLKLSKNLIFSIIIFFLFITPIVFQVISGVGIARYSKLSILSDFAVYQIGQSRLQSSLPIQLTRLLHNRPLFFATEFSKYYLSYFSPSFVYQVQGPQWQFAIPGKNLFTLPVTILSLIGGIYLIFKKKSKSTYFIFSWILFSPIAAALTADPPQSLRPTPMIPIVITLASIGFIWLVDLFKKYPLAKKIVTVSILTSCLFGYIGYLNTYYTSYKTTYSSSWQYGYQQAIKYIQAVKGDYDQIIFTKYYGEPHIFYAFFSRLDPKVLQPGGDNIRFRQTGWYWTDKIKNVYFVNDWQIPKNLGSTIPLESGGQVEVKNSLLVVSPQSLPQNAKILKTINFLNGSPALYIVTP